jgi:2-succinyl-5-enolpyruvyl-6-hydroxy-3-cyclohexene-1-carboxylate synthase
MNPSTQLARVIVRQIIEAGITDAVISPGSRNAPLSLALVAAEEKNLITLHIRIDERSAAFFALGLIKATKRPVPIICTSGTAVANYHPAVLEAHHTNQPLLVLTADRPAMLRRTGANQTTEQARIFGKAVRYFADVDGPVFPMELPLDSLRQGPVHLNIQFDEPLLPDADNSWLAEIKVAPKDFITRKGPGKIRINETRGALVIGHDRGGLSLEEVQEFAKKLGWPVIAEDPLSFPTATPHASLFLASTKIRQSLIPQAVVIIGRTTLSRSINSFIATSPITYVIDPRIATVDSDRTADKRFIAIPELDKSNPDEDWIATWKKFGERSAKVVAQLDGWNEATIAREISKLLPSNSSIFISSSRPIRDLEAFATPRSGVETFANRGLAGIDGNISSALGMAIARKNSYALIGDLAFLHDITGLITQEKINCRLLVINNDGGGIFSTLPQNGVAGFEQVFGTPHGLDPAAIATSMGIPATSVSNHKELQKEMEKPVAGISVVVINTPSRESNGENLKKIYQLIEGI